MSEPFSADLQAEVVALAERAGAAILEIYERLTPVGVTFKADRTPVTEADLAAHRLIAEGLSRLTPNVPLLSEEGAHTPYEIRRGCESLWLVDPLDGTKEFIKRNGEFTVNIARVERGRVVWGVVHAPIAGVSWWGGERYGSLRREAGGQTTPIRVRPVPDVGLTVLVSRSHPSPGLDDYLADKPVAERIPMGSSLKLCTLAEGRADLYPCFGITMEWDTAAGQAVVEGAGGIVRTPGGNPLVYNRDELRNGPFIARGAGR